jgi:hypothetical protein
MAGKRDEAFLLGEEALGADPCSAPAEEPTTTVPVPGPSCSSRWRASWPLILGAAVLAVAVAFLSRPGGDGAAPAPRATVPAVVSAPEVTPIARAPREADRPYRAPERQSQRPRSGARRKAMEEQPEVAAPLAESASAPVITYTPVPEAAPKPAPEGTAAAPAKAAPLPAARPEFGIER